VNAGAAPKIFEGLAKPCGFDDSGRLLYHGKHSLGVRSVRPVTSSG